MNKPITWILVFTGLLALSTAYLFSGGEEATAWFGLPGWLFVFFGIECLLIIAMALFTTYFWKASNDEE